MDRLSRSALNFTAKWKNFTFFALGTGGFGAYGMKNNSYLLGRWR